VGGSLGSATELDSNRAEAHANLIQGLEQLERVAGVVVISRPAKMCLADAKPTKGKKS
jgi:hypothetical protein